MKKIGILLVASAVMLSACGKRTEDVALGAASGYDADGNPIDGVGNAVGQVINVRVISDMASLQTGGQQAAQIKAIVTDDDNRALANQPISFSATAGTLQDNETETNDQGEATANLTLEYFPANQPITVTATSGNFSDTVLVVAEGSNMSLNGPTSVVPGGDVKITATLVPGLGQPLSGQVLTISSSAGSTLSAQTVMTNPQGVAEVTVTGATVADTIQFTALDNSAGLPSVVTSHSFTVSEDQLTFSDAVNSEMNVNNAHDIDVTWTKNGTPVSGQDLQFSLTAGQIVGASTASTNGSGVATVSVLSSNAGPATLTATATSGPVLTKSVNIEFVGDSPAAVKVSSSNTRVSAGSEATITALVEDANGNPVKNREVVFTSANLKGGQLNQASAISDVNGEASVVFQAGSAATNTNEIVINAEVQGTSISSATQLTVVEPVLNVTLGSSNWLEEDETQTQFSVAYVVQVADGAGKPIEGATVQLSIEPIEYYEGFLGLVDTLGNTQATAADPATWSADRWAVVSRATCATEDQNGNRILDAGEDLNGNGRLDPQDSALVGPIVDETTGENIEATIEGNGVLTTNASGSGFFNVVYPVSNALWSRVRISARAQELGVESADHFTTVLKAIASDMNAVDAEPPNSVSPYGTDLNCVTADQ